MIFFGDNFIRITFVQFLYFTIMIKLRILLIHNPTLKSVLIYLVNKSIFDIVLLIKGLSVHRTVDQLILKSTPDGHTGSESNYLNIVFWVLRNQRKSTFDNFQQVTQIGVVVYIEIIKRDESQ